MLINGMSSVILAASIAATAMPPAASTTVPTNTTLRTSIESVARTAAATEVRQAARLPRAATTARPPHRRSAGRIIAGVLIGGTVGFFAGGYTGIFIENKFNPCNCDDPGLMGAIIGAPIGAVVGAVAGGLIAK
jgi:hypothetical protein